MAAQRDSPVGPLDLQTAEVVVYRVGYAPDPFAWTPWQYANDGRFDGRWDDPDGTYRTLYVGDRLLGCLLEVLADFRPDLELLAEIDAIIDDDGSYPTVRGGVVPRSWLEPRCAGQAMMAGEFTDVRAAGTIAALRRRFADALTMWAVFEQPGEDATGSAALREAHAIELDVTTPALVEAMAQHGLVWG